jgi:hypothetical protein
MWREAMDKRKKMFKSKKMTREEFDDACQKFQDQVYKQETLLYIAYHLLLHLSEDTRVEIKVVLNRDVWVFFLIQILAPLFWFTDAQ